MSNFIQILRTYILWIHHYNVFREPMWCQQKQNARDGQTDDKVTFAGTTKVREWSDLKDSFFLGMDTDHQIFSIFEHFITKKSF